MRFAALALAALTLAGCVETGDTRIVGPAPEGAGESISLYSGPSGFVSRRYVVTVMPDGRGFFFGQRQTAVLGRHAFKVPSKTYRALADLLAPLRPETEGAFGYTAGSPGCEEWGTDAPTAVISWLDRNGTLRQFIYDFGCSGRDGGPIDHRIAAAFDLLPIDAMVDSR